MRRIPLPCGFIDDPGDPDPESLEWWRWHFAGIAMQGLITNLPTAIKEYVANGWSQDEYYADLVIEAVRMAEVLIAKLRKEEDPCYPKT